ncbi:MAG TPA: glycosyltransferase [Scandinavium sp.]|jgi:rhamnosyltransferase|uniref:glycosyltransferase family 2 protein n=1 Tax=Scandinavium sp. TaxID=2830653 RepID=UPI002E312F70|nr:glycosyltransferase [Scandinavium sp.]HEX4500169.1 glycosyltransferase [Scandinavium sp.]
MDKNVCVIVPTCNGGEIWERAALQLSKLKNKTVFIITIDSESTDSTREISEGYGFDVIGIKRKDFNHGGTRNIAARYCIDKLKAEFLVFLTQDAILQTPEKVIDEIVKRFEVNADISAIYGKQLPHDDANYLAEHARYYNYRDEAYKATPTNCCTMGLKAVFLSNSFSAYHSHVFSLLGGFPENTILCEDMYFAAKSIKNGYSIGYCPDVAVKHSHNYTPLAEFKRYFDIGVFHSCEPWINQMFGGATGEGKKFLFSEANYLIRRNPLWIVPACINNAMKLLGYKAGKNFKRLSPEKCKALSMHKAYWKSETK